MRTSQAAPSDRTSCWPSALAILIVTDFLPRLTAMKYAESPVSVPSGRRTNGGPKERVSSPLLGRSTLSTSAPTSASTCVHHGRPFGLPATGDDLARSSVDQDAGVQDVVRIQPLLDCLQCVGKQFGPLAVVPSPVVAANRM